MKMILRMQNELEPLIQKEYGLERWVTQLLLTGQYFSPGYYVLSKVILAFCTVYFAFYSIPGWGGAIYFL